MLSLLIPGRVTNKSLYSPRAMLSDSFVPQSVPRGFNDQHGCRCQGGFETEVTQTLERGPRAGVGIHLQLQNSWQTDSMSVERAACL